MASQAFESFPEAGLNFLLALSANNNREWFQANKKAYERDLKKPARALVEAVNAELESISPRHVTPAGKAINRINRDIRFSKDKTPYNTNVWAAFLPQDMPKGQGAGFYVGFTADTLGVGCGAWSPDKERLACLRAHFAANLDAWNAMTSGPDFAFVIGSRDAYKRVPKPYPADHPAAELLKLKGVHFKGELDPKLLTSKQLIPTIAQRFTQLAPVVAFLNQGMGA